MTPITHGGTDRGYKLCKCAKCGVERECTPAHDFYTPPNDPGGPLSCYSCTWRAFMEKKRLVEQLEEQEIQNRIKARNK